MKHFNPSVYSFFIFFNVLFYTSQLQAQTIQLNSTWLGNGVVNIQANPSGFHINCNYEITIECSNGERLTCITGDYNTACVTTFSGLTSGNYTFIATATRVSGPPGNCPLTIIIAPISVLPVLFSDFDVKLTRNNEVSLYFITEQEINCERFEIERSANGEEFMTIASLKGAGNSEVTLRYEYVDQNPPAGVLVYRVKQMDFDGKFSYTDAHSVKIIQNQKYQLLNTVVSQSLEIHHLEGHGEVVLFGTDGKIVAHHRLHEGWQTIDMSELANGMYFVSSREAGSTPIKFVKI